MRRLLLAGVLGLACGGPAPLTVDMPLHLEEHLDAATIVGSEVPANLPEPLEWHFDRPQPDWKATRPWNPTNPPARLRRTTEGLQVTLTDPMRNRGGNPRGGIYIDLPDLRRAQWAYLVIRARSENEVSSIGVGFNLRDGSGTSTDQPYPYEDGDGAPVVRDGTVQTYQLRVDRTDSDWEGPWRQLGLWFGSDEPGSIEILSVSLVSKAVIYAEAPHGVRTVTKDNRIRRTLYTHTPARFEYRIRVPQDGRVGLSLGVLRGDVPARFQVAVEPPAGEPVIVLDEEYGDAEAWAVRQADLADFSGQTVTLALQVESDDAGEVAFWGAPTVSGARRTDRPNVIFYIIDGGSADYMSVYGYNRRTTPNLERIAAEGALFERVYSNSTWSKPSTATFMTSLQHSVLGGIDDFDPIPDDAHTMAQHMHRAGYETGVFVANSYAGSVSNLEREVDVFRDVGVDPNSVSSVELHDNYWNWRDAYPGEPYWVHFQTTDVHWPWAPVAPFAGLFVDPEVRETYVEWEPRVRAAARRSRWPREAAFEQTGISRIAYDNARRGLYDESMAHNDYQIGRLVERLKARGEWEHTLLIVAADHSHYHAGLGLLDPVPPRWGPMFRSSVTRVPLIVVWPERIAPGQRFRQPVSMIDMLPTVLDLADLPLPDVLQGQSLAPLLLGTEGWEPRPVILDEFYVEESGELSGTIDVIDGRWGASLSINPPDGLPPERQRPTPLLLYDLLNDPMALHVLNEERPDLVEKYTVFLEAQFEAHQSLAQLFTVSGDVVLTPEQLETLRALGYIN